MGKYMTVSLKEEYKDDPFIKALNKTLTAKYGADEHPKFNPWYALQSDADYMNSDPEGKKQLPDWKRPITAKQLSKNFFWLTNGEFSFKLSGGVTIEEAKEAIAVCKWLIETENQFIDIDKSNNYDRETVAEYLDYLFEDAGSDLAEVWKISITVKSQQENIIMNTNFFKQIAKMDMNSRLMLTIAKTNDTNLLVSILVQNEGCNDKAKNIIPPLNISGTPEELDEGFFETIRTPIQTATGLMTNMEEFMKQLEVAKQQSAMEKEKTDKQTKEKEAKAKKFTEAIQKAEALEKEGKFKDAWTALPKISEFPEQAEAIRKRMSELEKSLAPSLFGEPIE